MDVKSGKQRKKEVKANRLDLLARRSNVSKRTDLKLTHLNRVTADSMELAHNNIYGLLPAFYEDLSFDCRDCNSPEIWTAAQQKWWYEVIKASIDSRAVRCRSCRLIERSRADEARRVSVEGMKRKAEAKQKKE